MTDMLAGKVIAVTGAAGVLGSAVARVLAGHGAKVLAIDFAAEIGDSGQVESHAGADLADAAAADKLFAGIGGGLHGLVNVAGGFTWVTVTDSAPDEWERLFRLNVLTAVNACKAALPALTAAGGAIVNVGAAATAKAAAGMGPYTATKSGVSRLTEALAEELKDRGVRVNAVLPTIIDTATNRADMPDAEFDRWVTPEALGEVIAFLLSDRASAVTGALVPVSGRV
jgi:NAD(P)-dependent dehydrogenase (short-subunit alcohol dehydrogenase family)